MLEILTNPRWLLDILDILLVAAVVPDPVMLEAVDEVARTLLEDVGAEDAGRAFDGPDGGNPA